jgi:hypothetical protein
MSTRNLPAVKMWPARKADNLTGVSRADWHSRYVIMLRVSIQTYITFYGPLQ